MRRTSTLLFATVLAFAGSATAAPVTPFVRDHVSRVLGWSFQSDDSGLIFVQNRGRGGGAQRQRPANAQRSAGTSRGGFNSSDFHQNVSDTRNLSANRNVNVNANRNVNVSGACCYGNYNTGPTWGGVAAGVAVGAMVGAAASSPTYVAPPPTYPPGYVTPPPY